MIRAACIGLVAWLAAVCVHADPATAHAVSMDPAPAERVVSMDPAPAERIVSMNPSPAERIVSMNPSPAERIVSMNPSLTAILVALGAKDTLVGVDAWSHESQDGLEGIPSVGGLGNPSLERVVALRPDLVVLVPSFEQRDFRAQLRGVGIRVLELDPKAWDEVLATIRALGRAVGRGPEAARRVAAIQAARSEVESAVSGRPRPRTVLVLQREPLFVVGTGSFIDTMLRVAGARNLGSELDGAYPRAGLEWLVSRAPEVLLDSSTDPTPAVEYWSRWASLPAVRDGRVVGLGPGTATLPGPWLDRALRILAEAVQGEPLMEPAP